MACLVSFGYFGKHVADWIRIPLSVYTTYLGYYIIRKAFIKKLQQDKVKRAGWLAAMVALQMHLPAAVGEHSLQVH
ncbi:MAG: hypothetical protein WDM71_08665 [Ferruginibacter sp.]